MSFPLPLDPDCSCPACAGGFSRAYLRHLYVSREMLALRLISLHNLHLYGSIMRDARAAIRNGRLRSFVEGFLRGAA